MKDLLRLYRSVSQYIYFGLLTILAVFLPFSVYVVSVCEIGLLINLLIEGDYKNRFRIAFHRKSLIVFLCIYAVHLIWVIGSSDFAYALLNLKIKLPLLVLPVIIAVSLPLNKQKIKLLLGFFIASIITATLISTVVYLGLTPYKVHDIRGISIFISHIRLSLLIVIAILVLLKWIAEEGLKITFSQIFKLTVVIWLVLFMLILKSFTGIVVLTVTSFILLLAFLRFVKIKILRKALLALLIAIPVVIAVVINNEIIRFYNFEQIDIKALDKKTVNGNIYYHDPSDWNVENGHKLWMYLCQPELRKEWNKRSNLNYDSFDMKQQPLAYTLIRYMTSKGLRKDSVGVSKLLATDISLIEQGVTNVIYTSKLGLKPRIYEVIWEFDQYKHGKSVNQHSVTQRIIYMQIALNLIRDNFWFGVGTGDLPSEYANYYRTHDTGLTKDRQLHTHNQFLRFFCHVWVYWIFYYNAGFYFPCFSGT